MVTRKSRFLLIPLLLFSTSHISGWAATTAPIDDAIAACEKLKDKVQRGECFEVAAKEASKKRSDDATALEDFISKAKQLVQESFVDPESARYRNLRITQKNKSPIRVLCGEVNAKNRYGGYVGYRRFHVVQWVEEGGKLDAEMEGQNIISESTKDLEVELFEAKWRLSCVTQKPVWKQ